ncbi:dUTP diphosphatase [Brevibacillus laterosporus]|uniref:dUTP diphosphatase n=1 Tax=Brevibacillus laterosporus TaxID=1465 RepID=A0AAP3DHT9_BRELA|nr:dUTP diphosphatase [Brevibacillus laterosporus]MCR8981619.1 dUTP diphosphatase [Brevibacillus laterosporus]MCZ0808774.1 dUTP diphosphatase [Brevibacillus laterosporus]MCZ0827253.1 dUTP diphosphatase [Brevibacillus laterosporus]MCZ0851009.1 dUTP diphosphatase [Brevibacillus laterosporus]
MWNDTGFKPFKQNNVDLKPFFEKQRQLNDYIIKKKGLEDQDLWGNTILALRVELSELANEIKCFKHWSDKRMNREKALEEAADTLHFFLSVGIYLGIPDKWDCNVHRTQGGANFTAQFNRILDKISTNMDGWDFFYAIPRFIALIYMLGFTWDDIAEAYDKKWQINIQRQESGY